MSLVRMPPPVSVASTLAGGTGRIAGNEKSQLRLAFSSGVAGVTAYFMR